MLLRTLASHALFPLLIAALVAFAVWISSADLAGWLGLDPSLDPVLLLAAATLSFFPCIALLERLAPYRAEWNRDHLDTRPDALFLATGAGIGALFDATLRGAALAGAAQLSTRFGLALWPSTWPAVSQLFLAILVAELGHYAFHRLGHESKLVWRVHAAHHAAPRLYWLNATRFHPIDLFAFVVLQNVPLILLGPPPRTYLMYAAFAAVYGQIQHSNVALPTPRPLDWIFSTPGLHRFHHSTNPREGNTNYGGILIAWDLVFGSFFRPRDRGFSGSTGIGAMPDFPRGYLAQLASPFRWKKLPRACAR